MPAKEMSTAAAQKAVVDGLMQKINSAKGAWETPEPMTQRQKGLIQDPGVRGPVWVSRVTVPEEQQQQQGSDVEEKVWMTVKDLSEGVEIIDRPKLAPEMPAEWVGARAGVSDPKAPEPDMAEADKYKGIIKDARSNFTILFIRGGALAFASRASARPTLSQLCQLSGARGFSFDYRLAPQHTWPTQLVDAFRAYLYLLSPPAGSFHNAIPASSIVLAGESLGASLCFAIVQVILHLRRKNITSVRYAGKDVPLGVPAGITGLCIAGEVTWALPSWSANKSHDWGGGNPPWLLPNFPADSIWPSNPPRGNLQSDNSVMCHPLLSLAAARNWKGAPPIWIACGEEVFEDGAKMVAQAAAREGVPVQFELYEYMPHVYAWVLGKLPQSKMTMKNWAASCKALAEDLESWKRNSSSHQSDGGGIFVRLGDLRTERLDVRNLLPFDQDEGIRRMRVVRDEWKDWAWKGLDPGVQNNKAKANL